MAGQLKVGGNIIASHSGVEGAGEVTLQNVTLGDSAVPSRSMNFRNKIINGDMRIAQRGTSATITSTSNLYLTVDRFNGKHFGASWAGVSHTTEEQSTDAPDGFSYSLKFTALTTQDYTNALGSWLEYVPENQDILSLKNGVGLKEFTISFWVKSNKVGNVTVSVESLPGYSYSTYVTINSADTWEFKTTTIPATSNDMNIDYTGSPNAGNLNLKFGMGSNGAWLVETDNQWNNSSTNRGVLSSQQTNFHESINDYIAFTGIQLEEGSVPTPFEHRPYGTELALCQRYYEKSDGVIWSSTNYFTSYIRCGQPFLVEKRASPEVILSGATNSGGSSLSLTVDRVCKSHFGWKLDSAGTSYGVYFSYTANSEL